ncbi:MAG: nucleotide exchange factor GrpE [Phycisphaerales bacterium]|nr:nucleotide exchange factor GrpE [Phycisphaerales bacterium]
MWKKDKPKTDAAQAPQPDDAAAAGVAGAAGEAEVEPKPDSPSPADARLAETEQQLGEMTLRWQRAMADFQNYQRRALENEREARRQAIASVVRDLLGVLDNFGLALNVDAEKSSARQVLSGVTAIRDMMRQVLAGHGVAVIEPGPGDEFDPLRHEAVLQIPAAGVEPGRVAQLLTAGYALEGRTLRPAKVAVAKPSDDPAGA